MKNVRVGIEAIAVALPKRFLPIEELARARGIDPAKLTVGLGAREMAVPDPGEDTVALAATAVAKLLATSGVDRSRVGMLVVGTETGVDHSKPVASFVQGLVGLPREMRTFDTQHACYGATAALMAASDWIASGSAEGRVAIVVASDIARYGLRTAGEPTQGGGAVALLVSEDPQLLELDRVSGTFSTDVHDFWRPIGRREAVVDGHYSIQCYLDAVAGAYRGWRERAIRRELVDGRSLASEQLARIAYHVPFCKMARKAHLHVRRTELEDRAGKPLEGEALAAEEKAGGVSFETQVASSLWLPSQVGNTYTAALYMSLASLLHADASDLVGKRIGMFSYGSGCSSELFSGVVGTRAATVIARAGLDAALTERIAVDVAEYERITSLPADAPLAEAPSEGGFRFTGVVESRRTYAGR